MTDQEPTEAEIKTFRRFHAIQDTVRRRMEAGAYDDGTRGSTTLASYGLLAQHTYEIAASRLLEEKGLNAPITNNELAQKMQEYLKELNVDGLLAFAQLGSFLSKDTFTDMVKTYDALMSVKSEQKEEEQVQAAEGDQETRV